MKTRARFPYQMTTSASVRSITAVRPPSGISTMPLPEPGEGAQAYGWGTYVTEVEGIARKYAAHRV